MPLLRVRVRREFGFRPKSGDFGYRRGDFGDRRMCASPVADASETRTFCPPAFRPSLFCPGARIGKRARLRPPPRRWKEIRTRPSPSSPATPPAERKAFAFRAMHLGWNATRVQIPAEVWRLRLQESRRLRLRPNVRVSTRRPVGDAHVLPAGIPAKPVLARSADRKMCASPNPPSAVEGDTHTPRPIVDKSAHRGAEGLRLQCDASPYRR